MAAAIVAAAGAVQVKDAGGEGRWRFDRWSTAVEGSQLWIWVRLLSERDIRGTGSEKQQQVVARGG